MLSINGITTYHHSELTKTMGGKETNMMTEDKMKIVVCNTVVPGGWDYHVMCRPW